MPITIKCVSPDIFSPATRALSRHMWCDIDRRDTGLERGVWAEFIPGPPGGTLTPKESISTHHSPSSRSEKKKQKRLSPTPPAQCHPTWTWLIKLQPTSNRPSDANYEGKTVTIVSSDGGKREVSAGCGRGVVKCEVMSDHYSTESQSPRKPRSVLHCFHPDRR